MKTSKSQKFLILLSVLQLVSGASVTPEDNEALETTSTTWEGNETVESTTTTTTTTWVTTEQTLEVESTTETAVDTTTAQFIDDYSTTPIRIPLELYAVQHMLSILNHLLRTSYEFVTEVLQESTHSIYARDKLKTYAEHLLLMLEDGEETLGKAGGDYTYSIVLRKSAFLKGKTTRQLPAFLPKEWVENYLKIRADISVWLDQMAEEMRAEFIGYVSNDEDQLKYQYFNENFDDVPRVNEIQQKIHILLDLVKVATNRKQITFMDLYMQT